MQEYLQASKYASKYCSNLVCFETAYMNNKTSVNKSFQGFYYPEENWFRMPNIWTDITSGMASLAELKVVEYVLRHTWGYQEFGKMKKITLDEFESGRKKTDGTRMDKGIGMRKQAIISGLRQAVKDGFLVEEVDKSDKGRIKKFYGLRMLQSGSADEDGGGEVKQMYENHTPGVRQSHSRDMKAIPPSEKDTKERQPKKNTVANGNINKTKDIKLLTKLPRLNQPTDKTKYVADYILEELKDEHSRRFYEIIASKIPEDYIRQAISEIKADGAESPQRVFTFRMMKYALGRNTGSINPNH